MNAAPLSRRLPPERHEPMSQASRILRRTSAASLVFAALLTVFLLSGCGKTPDAGSGDLTGNGDAGGDDALNSGIAEEDEDLIAARNAFTRNDFETAARHFALAAERDIPEAQYMFGECLERGLGIEKDPGEAIRWWRKAAENGSADAQYRLGQCYEDGKYLEKNMDEAVKWWEKAAGQGLVIAQYTMGVCCEYGKGVEKDLTKAIEWYRNPAEQGYAPAQYNLGVCCYYGYGTEQDERAAEQWFRLAADQGLASAQYMYGVCKFNARDSTTAAEWFRKAAELDHAGAQYMLGLCLFNANAAEAAEWFRKAAEQDHAGAQCKLGECYERGRGVDKDLSEAVNWYRKAADQDFAEAQYDLGEPAGLSAVPVSSPRHCFHDTGSSAITSIHKFASPNTFPLIGISHEINPHNAYTCSQSHVPLSKFLQHLLRIVSGFDLAKRFHNHTVFNQIGRADHSHGRFAVVHLLFPDIIGLNHRQIRVRKQNKRQGVFLPEFLMTGNGVLADANDHSILFRELRIQFRKATCLFGAAGSHILGIEIQHDSFPRKFG